MPIQAWKIASNHPCKRLQPHRRGFCHESQDPGSWKLFLGSGDILKKLRKKLPLLCMCLIKARGVVIFHKITGVSLYLGRKNDNWLKYMSNTSFIVICLPKMSRAGSCGIPGYPGIPGFSKSNPGIFWDFQKPLDDCILRLSTPFFDHNNLFWDL